MALLEGMKQGGNGFEEWGGRKKNRVGESVDATNVGFDTGEKARSGHAHHSGEDVLITTCFLCLSPTQNKPLRVLNLDAAAISWIRLTSRRTQATRIHSLSASAKAMFPSSSNPEAHSRACLSSQATGGHASSVDSA